MGAPKLEKFPVQLLGLDSIKVDHAIQSRVATNMEYQREFSEAMLRGDTFPPVTVFFDGKVYWLADGFHRYGAAKQASRVERRFEGIRAEIRPGTRRDAIVFSAGANREFAIPRTKEDIRKAIRMLLDDPEWFSKSLALISKHIGVSTGVVRNERIKYCSDKGMPLPESIVGEHGFQHPSHKPLKGKLTVRKRRNANSYYIVDGRKLITLGDDKEKAIATASAIEEERAKKRISIDSTSKVQQYLERRGFLFEYLDLHNLAYPGLQGIFVGHGLIITSETFTESDGILKAIARVLLSRQYHDPSARAVVVCYPEDAPPVMLDLARQLGVEFLTPEELVASIKGNEQEP